MTDSDFLGAIVGEIGTMGTPVPSGIQPREDGSWLVDGGLPIEDLQDALELGSAAGRRRSTSTRRSRASCCTSSAAFRSRRITSTGTGWRFEVVDMDGRRVDKVLVSRREWSG